MEDTSSLPPDVPHQDTPEERSWGTAQRPRKPRKRALAATIITVSYLALAAGTAAAVVAVGSPAPLNLAALTPGSGSASASVSTSATAASTPSASATSASPSPSPSPSPKSTVTGSVRDGVHRGDLRYFLLPPPDGPSSVHGDPDGTTESSRDVQRVYGGSSKVKSALDQLGFKGGASRTYQDEEMGANVRIELLQFGSGDEAGQWLQGFQLSGSGWTSFSIPGQSGATAAEKHSDDLDSLIGVYAAGDTFYEIDVYGSQTVPHADLSNVMTAEYNRLTHG